MLENINYSSFKVQKSKMHIKKHFVMSHFKYKNSNASYPKIYFPLWKPSKELALFRWFRKIRFFGRGVTVK